MQIIITAVTPKTVEVQGQKLTREYAEGILLPLLVAAQGKNYAGISKVSQAFVTAGLRLEGSPEAVRVYHEHLSEKLAQEARQRAEAKANAERCYVPTPQEIAAKKAKRQADAEAIKAHGQVIRSVMGN